MENLVKFIAGKTYRMKYIGDSNMFTDWVCIKRTAKSVTFNRVDVSETITKRIKIHDGSEYALYGNYSMAPVIQSERIVEA
jgi:hypothetical protein